MCVLLSNKLVTSSMRSISKLLLLMLFYSTKNVYATLDTLLFV